MQRASLVALFLITSFSGAQDVIVVEGTPAPAPAGAATPPAGDASAKPSTPAPSLLDTLKKTILARTPTAVFERLASEASGPELPLVGPPRSLHAPIIDKLMGDVARGSWAGVGEFLQNFKADEARQAYLQILTALSQNAAPTMANRGGPPQSSMGTPMPMPMPLGGAGAGFAETNILLPSDLLAIADLCPAEFDDDILSRLGTLLSAALARGSSVQKLSAALAEGTAKLGGRDPARRLLAARWLEKAGQAAEIGQFLPPLDDAESKNDAAALNLLAVHFQALNAREGRIEWLEKAWRATQAVLSGPEASDEAREQAMVRAVEMVPRLRDELGRQWLLDAFAAEAARGMKILATIGTQTVQGRRNFEAEFRRKKLDLQSRAVEALLEASPQRVREWSGTLTLLAMNWLVEARWSQQRDTSTSRGPQTRYDPFGNVYFMNDDETIRQQQMMSGNREPQAIPSGQILAAAPGATWLEAIDDSLRPGIWTQIVELQLKVKDEEKAFPFIEKIAAFNAEEGRRLAERFVDAWADNHDPNADKRRTNRFMYIYGYNPGVETISLTRSKQTRNLEQLGAWVKRLRALPIGTIDEAKIARAFVVTHSQAEVYSLGDIEKVFGDIGTLKPETIGRLVQTMRQNLATVWRSPKIQQENKTKRTDKEIAAEVQRGYEVAGSVLANAQKKFPDDWSLQLARAALMFDANNFANEQSKDPQFAARRDAAYAEFARAADLYATALPGLDDKQQSADVYQTWFYASLGAADLEGVRHEQQPAPKQWPLITAALDTLPGEAAKKHRDMFANALTTRLSAVQPELKHRYLGAGLPIARESERAQQAKDLFAYYDDLVTEIKLDVRIDGSDRVGHEEPFGLFVNLRHSKAIEREAGGFQRYLQNQNNQPYFYNFGRPTENYRDKFEEAARAALGESFDVLSVTFHSEKIQSRGDPEEGWRVTPYAYLLLKPKGPHVDAIPALKVNLDFLDTSGYVILPIESPKLPIDTREVAGDPRPLQQVEIKQILDERKADKGELVLEVKASAHGLVPKLDALIEFNPPEFQIVKRGDEGVKIVQLDAESDENAVVSERTWTITMTANPAPSGTTRKFQFGRPIEADFKSAYFRYADADLAESGPEISLLEKYGRDKFPWGKVAGGIVLCGGLAAVVVWWRRRRRPVIAGASTFQVPDELNSLTVIGLLQRIRASGRVTDAAAVELERAMAQLEAHYYSRNNGTPVDLHRLAHEWVGRVS